MKLRYLTPVSALLMLPVSWVNADALLFPYVVTSPTVASIASIVNKDSSGQLFLQYFYKIDVSNHASECNSTARTEVDSGTNDLVSFEANGKFVGPSPASITGGPLFNDPGVNVNYGGSDFTMGLPGSVTRAFLVADDGDSDGEDLYGEMMILETQGGAAWGYVAFNPADDSQNGTFDASDPGFSGANDIHGEALDNNNGTDSAPVTILPANEWFTRFFVTPLGDNNQRACADCSARVEMSRTGGGGTDGMFDRDGNPLSGNNSVNVVCVSGVSIEDLVPASVEAVVNQQGGFGFIDIDTGLSSTQQGTTSDTEDAAAVIKLEFNKVQYISPSMSNSFTGTVNTAVWLRNANNSQGVGAF